MANKSTFEEELERTGKLIYTNVGDSMMPLIRQDRDLLIIEKKPEGRLKNTMCRYIGEIPDSMCCIGS